MRRFFLACVLAFADLCSAAGLKGNRLMINGTGDDNCHCRWVERLANKLIELNRPFTSAGT